MTQKTDNHLSANGEKKCTLKEGIGKVGGSVSHSSWFETWFEKQKLIERYILKDKISLFLNKIEYLFF